MVGNSGYVKLWTVSLFAMSINSLVPIPIVWAQECTTEAINRRFPHAVSAIHQWSVQYSVVVGSETTNLILDDFCQAANTIQVKKAVGDGAIDKVAPEVIFEYLDGENDSSLASVSSIGAILRTALGASGLAPQRLKRVAILEMTYNEDHPIDYLEIDGNQMAPLKRIMKLPGHYLVMGIQGTSIACKFQVELRVNHPYPGKC